jgi:hypothetical protein
MSGQASAEPMTGPTLPARSRTRSALSPGAASAAIERKELTRNAVQRRHTKDFTTQLLIQFLGLKGHGHKMLGPNGHKILTESITCKRPPLSSGLALFHSADQSFGYSSSSG